MQNQKYFLIDDDSDDRDILSFALKKIDSAAECISATDGENALEILGSQPSFVPNYIFLDLNMPLMDGRMCLAELKTLPSIKEVPIIIYTTSSYPKDIDATKDLGAAHFLVKPSSLKGLVEILATVLGGTNLPFLLRP